MSSCFILEKLSNLSQAGSDRIWTPTRSDTNAFIWDIISRIWLEPGREDASLPVADKNEEYATDVKHKGSPKMNYLFWYWLPKANLVQALGVSHLNRMGDDLGRHFLWRLKHIYILVSTLCGFFVTFPNFRFDQN